MPFVRKPTARTRTIAARKALAFRRSRSLAARRPLSGDGRTFSLEQSVPRARFPVNPRTFSFVQTFTAPAWLTQSGSVPVSVALNSQIGQLNQYSTLASIFDQYRIDEIEVWLTPLKNSAAVSIISGQLATVIDYDDATPLASFGLALEYPNAVVTNCAIGHYRRYVPRIANAVYGSAAFGSFGNSNPQWLDIASSTIEHYGVKVVVTPSTGTQQIYDLTVRMKCSFLSVR